MNLHPHHGDVVQITGHVNYQGHDIHGQIAIVDDVDDRVVTMHRGNNDHGILARPEDLDVLYRTLWP